MIHISEGLKWIFYGLYGTGLTTAITTGMMILLNKKRFEKKAGHSFLVSSMFVVIASLFYYRTTFSFGNSIINYGMIIAFSLFIAVSIYEIISRWLIGQSKLDDFTRPENSNFWYSVKIRSLLFRLIGIMRQRYIVYSNNMKSNRHVQTLQRYL